MTCSIIRHWVISNLTTIVAITCLFSLADCANKAKDSKNIISNKDTLVDPKLYAEFHKLSQQLNIADITSVVDSVQFRFWIYGIGGDSSSLIMLSTHDKKEWVAKQYTFWQQYESDSNRIVGITKKELIPKNGWQNLSRKIGEINPGKFRFYDTIPGFSRGISTHCLEIILESYDTKKHSILPYPCFEFYHTKIEEVTTLVNFLTFLQEDLGVSLPPGWHRFPIEG